MEVPESVRIGLENVRSTLHARWNPQGKAVGERSFDVNGVPRVVEWEGRWELWDKGVATGEDYKVVTLEKDGQYVPLGEWVLQLVYDINPANYDGDLHKMIEALVDKPNEDVARLGREQYGELLDYMADLCWSEKTRGSRVVVPRMVAPQMARM